MQFFDKQTLAKLDEINKQYCYLTELLTFEEVITDINLCKKLQIAAKNLQDIATNYQNFVKLCKQIDDLQKLKADCLPSERDLFVQEIDVVSKKQTESANKLKMLLLHQNAKFQKIVVQIVFGAAAQKLAADIAMGYTNFCKNNGFRCEVLQDFELQISGMNAFEFFKNEVGLHMADDGAECKVFVLQSFDVAEPSFEDADIKISVCRASGAGGQHINTTDSAIKAQHLPTGIVATCQDQRSQFQNKQKAIQTLKQKVLSNFQKQKADFYAYQKTKQLKLANIKHIAKKYNYADNDITKSDKTVILLGSFLSGKAI